MDARTQTLQGGLNDSMYHVCTYIIGINAGRLLHDAMYGFHMFPYNIVQLSQPVAIDEVECTPYVESG